MWCQCRDTNPSVTGYESVLLPKITGLIILGYEAFEELIVECVQEIVLVSHDL